MKKLLPVILFFLFILIMEAVPFLYKEGFTIADMKWGYIIAFPIVMFFWGSYNKRKEKNKE